MRYVTAPDGTHHLVVPGRASLPRARPGGRFPFLVARVEYLPDTGATNPEVEARALYLKQKAVEAISLLPQAPAELANAIQAIESPSTLADMVASFLDIKAAEKQELLETFELKRPPRARLEPAHAARRGAQALAADRGADQGSDRRAPARSSCCASRCARSSKELGEDGQGGEEIAELREAIDKAGHAARRSRSTRARS